MQHVDNLLITTEVTLRDALAAMSNGARNVLLLVDGEGRFARTVTDGDLRRLLLAGAGLEATLDLISTRSSWTVGPDVGTDTVLELMDRHGIDQIPVLDRDGRPVGIHLRREIDRPVLLSTPHLSEYERQYVDQAFATNWIAPVGPNVDAFEEELAAAVGVGHAAALSSGTAAIHLGLHLLDVGPGDLVFCSSLTFVATVNPIRYLGAEPVFIDSDPDTWNMSPEALERALDDAAARGRLPKAVVPVGLYGLSPEMERIAEICDRHGVPILEDAAESLGATYRGRSAGTFGRLGVYSFNGNKIITTSGGGMLVGDDRELIERARFLSTQARDPAPHYQHSEIGFNYRMSNILAGVGRGQLKVLPDRVARRREVFHRYLVGLGHLEGIDWMPEPAEHRASRWLTAATIDPVRLGCDPATLIQGLAAARIEARPVWKPMHLQPVFEGCRFWAHDERAPTADRLFTRGICLPSGSNLTPARQQRVVDRILEIVADSRSGSRSIRLTARAG